MKHIKSTKQKRIDATACSDKKKPWWVRPFEQGLLIVVLATAVLRATFTETPHIETFGQWMPLSNEAVSLLLSSVLFAALAVWLVVYWLSGQLRRRSTGFAVATGAFALAGLIGVLFASDKRAALTDIAVLLSGPAAGLLAVQVFNRRETVRLFLWLLLAVGAAATYACYEKSTESNAQLIAEYEKDPAAMLEMFGIEPDSLEHWMYEHRLYSQDISGFLTTSNSAGAFFLLAIFAGLGLCVEAFRARGNEETLVALVCTALATAIPLVGLWMTQSKGAIGSFLIFAPVLAACVVFGKTLWRWRMAVGVGLIVFALAAAAAMTIYGTQHGRLPGGNSMLVRWQYWAASAEMAQDYPLLGVGGGNFAAHYLRYKNPAAPETISDPHNWVFSVLCRFGLVGLLTLAAAMLRPTARLFVAAWRTTETGVTSQESGVRSQETNVIGQGWSERFMWIAILGGVLAVMLFVRPMVYQLSAQSQATVEHAAAFLLLILIPAGVIAVVFGLLRFACVGDAALHRDNPALTAGIACGLGAVLVQCLVDFAIFEPGVWTMFWLLAAAGVALQEPPTETLTTKRPRQAVLIAGAVLLGFGVYVWGVVVPPVQRGRLVYRALHQPLPQAEPLLERAVAVDPLSPNAAATAGRLLSGHFQQQRGAKDVTVPGRAQAFIETAVARNPADARLRRMLGQVLLTGAEYADTDAQRQALRAEAFEAFHEAVKRFDGSDYLHYQLGILAEELGRPDAAVMHLETALAIEMSYREQFRQMYPQQDEVVSRLGHSAVADVVSRLERLRGDSEQEP